MQYLGGLRGLGTVNCGEQNLGPADYELEGYLMKPGQMTVSGEIRMPPETLRALFGRRDLQLLTDNGHHFSLRFSEKELGGDGDVAHVDVIGGLPKASDWRR